MAPTPFRRSIDRLLDGDLDEFVTSRRAEGYSWRQISQDLLEVTKLDVADETLRGWFVDAEREDRAS